MDAQVNLPKGLSKQSELILNLKEKSSVRSTLPQKKEEDRAEDIFEIPIE